MTDATPLASEQITQGECICDAACPVTEDSHWLNCPAHSYYAAYLKMIGTSAPGDQDASQAQGKVSSILLPPGSVDDHEYLEGWLDGQTYLLLSQRFAAPGATAQDGAERHLSGETVCGFEVAAYRETHPEHGDQYGHTYSEHWSTPNTRDPRVKVERLFTETQLREALATPTPTIRAGMVASAAEIAQAIKATEYKYFGDYEMSDDQRAAVDVLVRVAQHYAGTPTPQAPVERCVMVCPQCEGEGSYADGLDDDACTTDCTRCGGDGWIVDRAALASLNPTTGAGETEGGK